MNMNKEKFKELSLEILPMITGMMEVLKDKVDGETAALHLNASEGNFSFNLYDTGWEFFKYSDDNKVVLKYQYREEIEMPEKVQEGVSFNHTTENVIEITRTFMSMARDNYHLYDTDFEEWKQKFVDWANEFEEMWEDDTARYYLDEIDKFAAEKINAYHKGER